MKRFIAILMTLCLMLGMSSVSVWADEGNQWQIETTKVGTDRQGAAVAVIGDEIYILGGNAGTNTSNSVDIYNVKTKQWRKGTSIPTSTSYAGSCVVGDKIYVIGGFNAYKLVQIYDTKMNSWTNGEPLPDSKCCINAVMINGKIYVAGGRNQNSSSSQNTLYIYNIAENKWSTGTPMPISTQKATMNVVEKQIYVIGGDNAVRAVQIYDIEKDKWSAGATMTTRRDNAMASAIGDNIYVMGGRGSDYVTNVEIYNTIADKWSSGSSITSRRQLSHSVVIGSKIYLVAGTSNTIEYLQVIDSAIKLSLLLNEGEKVQLSTSFNLDNNKKYTWTSTNEAVATVDANGKVTAVAEGTADIYAQNADGTFKEYIPVKVVEGIADELRLAVHLKAGEKAKLYLSDDLSKVTWSSMDESVATISSEGQVTGVKKGLAIVQAELDGQTYQIYVRVNG